MTDESGGPIRRAITVEAAPDRAFAVFTEDLAAWWPSEYTWSGEVLETIGIEPREGGHCFEIGPGGFRSDWGTVLRWAPPGRLAFAWQISPERVPEPNPARASEVEVRFEPEGEAGTRVELEHRGFARHGEGAEDYRTGLDSPAGWTLLLECYAAAFAA